VTACRRVRGFEPDELQRTDHELACSSPRGLPRVGPVGPGIARSEFPHVLSDAVATRRRLPAALAASSTRSAATTGWVSSEINRTAGWSVTGRPWQWHSGAVVPRWCADERAGPDPRRKRACSRSGRGGSRPRGRVRRHRSGIHRSRLPSRGPQRKKKRAQPVDRTRPHRPRSREGPNGKRSGRSGSSPLRPE
jgi:hypothetical protein